MTLVTYDVTAAIVLKHFPQWSISQATLPGSENITDEYINTAAANIEDAMLTGGFDSSIITSVAYPSAYYQLRYLVARLAALQYIYDIGVYDAETMAKESARVRKKVQDIKEGKRLGEFERVDTEKLVQWSHADENSTDIDARRASMRDYL